MAKLTKEYFKKTGLEMEDYGYGFRIWFGKNGFFQLYIPIITNEWGVEYEGELCVNNCEYTNVAKIFNVYQFECIYFGITGEFLFNKTLPTSDNQIRAYGLIQQISKLEFLEPSPYEPENDIRKKRIEDLKREYFLLKK